MKASIIKKIAASTAITWKDKKIAAARRARHPVRAKGVEFRSVAQAFETLKLPVQQAKSFRQRLVTERRARFENIQFTLLA